MGKVKPCSNRFMAPIHKLPKNIANPLATILAMGMMLDYFGLVAESDLISLAVDQAITDGFGTMDIAPKQIISCSAMGDFIAELLMTPRASWVEVKRKWH